MTGRQYIVDPRDPRAPAAEVWERLSHEERGEVVASLPSDIPRTTPPEGDAHRIPKERALSTLDEYFRRMGRRVYLSSELPVYYPDEPMFAPDLIAVLDVGTHPRASWVVSHEGKGLDFALEVHVSGDRKKDLELNVDRFARLGIPEYFAYEPLRGRLTGHRLARSEKPYAPILPQGGRWSSAVLGLDLTIEEGSVRFYAGSAALLDGRELIDRLTRMVDDAVRRAEDEAQRAEDEAQRAEDEAQRAEDEAQRAQDEAQRAERLAAKLRELGVDPDTA